MNRSLILFILLIQILAIDGRSCTYWKMDYDKISFEKTENGLLINYESFFPRNCLKKFNKVQIFDEQRNFVTGCNRLNCTGILLLNQCLSSNQLDLKYLDRLQRIHIKTNIDCLKTKSSVMFWLAIFIPLSIICIICGVFFIWFFCVRKKRAVAIVCVENQNFNLQEIREESFWTDWID